MSTICETYSSFFSVILFWRWRTCACLLPSSLTCVICHNNYLIMCGFLFHIFQMINCNVNLKVLMGAGQSSVLGFHHFLSIREKKLEPSSKIVHQLNKQKLKSASWLFVFFFIFNSIIPPAEHLLDTWRLGCPFFWHLSSELYFYGWVYVCNMRTLENGHNTHHCHRFHAFLLVHGVNKQRSQTVGQQNNAKNLLDRCFVMTEINF